MTPDMSYPEGSVGRRMTVMDSQIKDLRTEKDGLMQRIAELEAENRDLQNRLDGINHIAHSSADPASCLETIRGITNGSGASGPGGE